MSSSKSAIVNRALFLDRDGIINVDHGYVFKSEQFDFVDGIFDLCQQAMAKNYRIFVITNQAGIARGYYSEQDFLRLTDWMKQQFQNQGVIIDDVYYCPHHPTKGVNHYKMLCNCRKPAAGMIINAKNDHQLDLQQSIFIGDKISDMQAAEAAGIDKRILLASQYADDLKIAAHRIDFLCDAAQYFSE